MKIENIYKALTHLQFPAVLLASLLISTPTLALTGSVANVKFCEAGNIFCSIKTSDTLNMVVGGIGYLSELDNLDNKVQPNISDISFTCTSLTQKITGDAEWSAFLSELRHGNLVSLTRSSQQQNDAQGHEDCRLGEVQTSAAGWLFATALIGFVGLSNKRRV
jgi:hypothetical protein